MTLAPRKRELKPKKAAEGAVSKRNFFLFVFFFAGHGDRDWTSSTSNLAKSLISFLPLFSSLPR